MPEDKIAKTQPITELRAIMAQLRNPNGGCAWDLEQDFHSIAPHTIEEAYEVADAIESNDMDGLRDELGDVLFQVVFHAQMAEEKGLFDFDDVVRAISQKMISRHPHVFGGENFRTAEEQTIAWEEHKEKERVSNTAIPPSALDGVTKGLPALIRAVKLQKRAARVGFDWPETAQVIDKLNEEMAELSEELVKANSMNLNKDKIEEEFGDMMFVYANLARHLKIDPEAALRSANKKFERRFKKIEQYLDNQGKNIKKQTLEELDLLWDKAKAEERL